jgi:AraC family transcriptional regulator
MLGDFQVSIRSLTHTQLQQAIDYVPTHLGEDLSLVQIAKVINLSPTYFASLFKRATGLSPHQYVIKQRVKRAKLVLLTTDLTIALHCITSGVFQSKPSDSTL